MLLVDFDLHTFMTKEIYAIIDLIEQFLHRQRDKRQRDTQADGQTDTHRARKKREGRE